MQLHANKQEDSSQIREDDTNVARGGYSIEDNRLISKSQSSLQDVVNASLKPSFLTQLQAKVTHQNAVTPPIQRKISVNKKVMSVKDILAEWKADEDVVWHPEYPEILQELDLKELEFDSMPDLLLRVASVIMHRKSGGKKEKVRYDDESKGEEEELTTDSDEEELDSDMVAIMSSMTGKQLYRSMRTAEIEKAVASGKLEAIGSFFSPSEAYSLQYFEGIKAKGGTYDGFVEITLNKTIFEFYKQMLFRRKVHFQNAGKAKKLFPKVKTKKGAPYLLKLEGTVLNIQLVADGEISELNASITGIKKIR